MNKRTEIPKSKTNDELKSETISMLLAIATIAVILFTVYCSI